MARGNKGTAATADPENKETPVSDATATEAPTEAPTTTEAPATETPAATTPKEKVDPAVQAEAFKSAVTEAIGTADQASGAIPEANLSAVVTAYKALSPTQRGAQLAERMAEINAEALADPANVKVWMLQAAGAIQSAVAKSGTARGGAQAREKAAAVPAHLQLATSWAALHLAGEQVIPEGISDEDKEKARELFGAFRTNGEAEGVSGDLVKSIVERLVKAATTRKKGGGSGGPRNTAASLNMADLEGKTFTHKTKTGERTVSVKDGKWVLDDGTTYTSPTAAAKVVQGPTKDGKDPSVNGRRFWNIPS